MTQSSPESSPESPPEAEQAVEALRVRGLTLATAESLTGGLLSATLTAVPGASAAYVGGVVTYATRLKVALLGVPADTVERVGVVSAEAATAMASGVRDRLGADVGIATTGVAGPEPQEGKPVGLVYVGTAGPWGTTVAELRLTGGRGEVRAATVRAALAGLLAALVGPGAAPDGSADGRRA